MTKEEARAKAAKFDIARDTTIRSCWMCNPAHEHLKQSKLLNCFVCGHWYHKGIDITEDD